MVKQISLLRIELLRSETLSNITEVHILSATTFITNTQIISIRLVLQALNVYLLWLCFSVIKSISASNSIKPKSNARVLFPLIGTNSKPFSNKVLENLPYLWPASGPKLSGISNINRRKCKIRFPIYNTLSLFWWNLTYSLFPLKTCYITIFTKIFSY